jgi:uncharacterized protein with von Willebrand factor type A (vWA) domain
MSLSGFPSPVPTTRQAGDLLDGFLDDLGVTPLKRIDFLQALADNPPPDLNRLYWLARVTLVSRLEDIPSFDAVFATWFAGAPAIAVPPPDEEGETEAPQPKGDEELQPIQLAEGTGKSASVHELRHRRTYERTSEDLTELRKALAHHLPTRRALRLKPARRGPIDLRRTLRAATRTGEIVTLARRNRPHRPRPLLILIDVSGSLRTHTPDFLRFAHAAQAETFTFGTRLTRVTEQLRTPDVDTALANLSAHIPDADGGTRIGAALQEFLSTPRYTDRARGALVIVLSDGLERGDPAAMAQAVHRLARLSHRLVWWTPLGCDPTYRPITRAMAAIQDDLDDLAGARDLPTLLECVRGL